MSIEYIYLIQEREFIKTGENIYKIGMTEAPNLYRFKQYPNGSILILQIKCKQARKLERTIINMFKEKYEWKNDIGDEYFKGNSEVMEKDILNIWKNNINKLEDDENKMINDSNSVELIQKFICKYWLFL